MPNPLEDALPRRLGGVSLVGILIGVVIGSGIFRVPSTVMSEVGTVGAAALVWVVGGMVTICGALTLAELASTYPKAGGAYVFLREAYGPLVAFLFGWIKFVVTGPAAIAAVALVFAGYAAAFFPMGDVAQRLVAAGLVIGLALLNLRSTVGSAALQTLSTGAKVVALIALSIALLVFGDRSGGALAQPIAWGPTSWSGFGVALIAVFWTYVGWVDITYLAGEVKDPARSYARAAIWGLGLVTVVYVLANVAYLKVLPGSEVAASTQVAATAAERVFGATGKSLVAALVMLSTFGSLNATLLATPRVYFSMASDGVFFEAAGRVHAKWRTPYVAILVLMALGLVGLSTRTFEQLAQLFVLGNWPFYGLAVGSVFLARRRSGVTPAYRTWGYPVIPIVFLVVSAIMLVNGAVNRPLPTLVSLGVVALGIPVFYGWRAARARHQARSAVAP